MEFTGKTVEEAVELGIKSLNIEKDQAEIKIIEEPTKGLFGRTKGKAVVDIEKKVSKIENAVNFATNLFKYLDINAKATLDGDDNGYNINIIAENSSEIIGKKGDVLDAIQTLCSAVVNNGEGSYKKVTVNCENYREKREETLINLAHRLEEKATDMKRDVFLEPMSSFERRIIHSALSESLTVKTFSEGVEPNRYIVISPNEKDETLAPYNAGKNRDGKNKKFGKKFSDKKPFNKSKSGFSGEKRKTSFSFGTYLGNSKKDF